MHAAVNGMDMAAVSLHARKEPLAAGAGVEHGLRTQQPLAGFQCLAREISPDDRLAVLGDPCFEGFGQCTRSRG